MLRSTWWAGLGLSLVLITGCAGAGSLRAPRTDLSSGELWELYEKTVAATKVPQAAAISTALVPIVQSTSGLRWDGQGRVLMVTWTKRAHYEGSVGKPYTFTHGDVWLTAVPFAQRFCRTLHLSPDRLRLRLAQLLGMPPDTNEDVFVQMWIDPKDLFRPCADPEITDRECTLDLTTDGAPPGGCPWAGSFAGQTSARWSTVTREHLDWMCGNWTDSYPPDPRKAYPWTGLGYTYDWGSSNPVGQSEFVAPQGTTVLIESITGTAEYCGG